MSTIDDWMAFTDLHVIPNAISESGIRYNMSAHDATE
jgi:hypothetical protein